MEAPTRITSYNVCYTKLLRLGQDGSGIKIGVIDLGFGSLSTSQNNGELPLTGYGLTITDYTGTGNGGINHGTNVAERNNFV